PVRPEDSNGQSSKFYRSEAECESPEHSFQNLRNCLFRPGSASADLKRCTPAYCGNRSSARKEEFPPCARCPPSRSWKGHFQRFSAYKATEHHIPYSATCSLRIHRNACKRPPPDEARPASGPSQWPLPGSSSFFEFLYRRYHPEWHAG